MKFAVLAPVAAGVTADPEWMSTFARRVEAYGTDFSSRGRRTDEQLEVMRLLWDDHPDGASFHGEFLDFDHAMSYPKPAGRLPIHIGGHSRAAARRAGRIGDGFQPLVGPELPDLVALMRSEAIELGRDPAALELSLGHLVTKIDSGRAEKPAAMGADGIVLAMPPLPDLGEACDALSACAARLQVSS
jgi:hypothetical protein